MQSKNSKLKQLLLAAAVTGALASPAMAQTSVTVSGLVDVFAGSMRNAGDTSSKAVLNSGGMTTSWFGFKGTEDLGGGLKANFQLTSFIQADTGVQGRGMPNETLFSRDANVGLAGNFGEVSLGRGLAPNFLPMILFNPFGDSFNFSPLVLQHQVPLFNSDFSTRFASSIAGDTCWSNQIKYTTPSFGGLTANLHYQFGEAAGNNGKNNVGANVLYFNGPLSLTAFYHKVKVNNPLDTPTLQASTPFGYAEQKAWFIGGGYDLGVAKLYATYDKTTHDVSLEDKTTSLGLSVPVGAGKILAGYAQTKRSAAGVADVKRQTTTVGYDYSLSKRTAVYAMLMNDKLTGFESGNSFGLGIRHGF